MILGEIVGVGIRETDHVGAVGHHRCRTGLFDHQIPKRQPRRRKPDPVNAHLEVSNCIDPVTGCEDKGVDARLSGNGAPGHGPG